MSQLFASGGQSIGVSASASVLPMNIQGWISFNIDWFDLLDVQWTLKSLLQLHLFFGAQPALWSNSHILDHRKRKRVPEKHLILLY